MNIKQTVSFILLYALFIAASFALWYVQRDTLTLSGGKVIIFSSLLFSIGLLLSLSIVALVGEKKRYWVTAGILAGGVSIVYLWEPWYIVCIVVATIGIVFSVWRMRYEMRYLRIVSFYRLAGAGLTYTIYSLSFLIACQYFFILQSIPPERFVPQFSSNPESVRIAEQILFVSMPFLEDVPFLAKNKNFQRLQSLFENGTEASIQGFLQNPSQFIQNVAEAQHQPILTSQQLNEVLQGFFTTDEGRLSAIVAGVFGVILFATLLGLLLLLRSTILTVGSGIFWFLIKVGVIDIETKQDDVQAIKPLG